MYSESVLVCQVLAEETATHSSVTGNLVEVNMGWETIKHEGMLRQANRVFSCGCHFPGSRRGVVVD